jgi:hypothetical protein
LKTFAIVFLSYAILVAKVLDIWVISDGGTSIPACRICVSGIDTCVYSDFTGYAAIEYYDQTDSILFSASGYADTIVSDVQAVDTLTIQLREQFSIASLAPIRVTASQVKHIGYELKNRPILITSQDILNTAGTAGDISRYIATLPSVVASISEGYDNTLYVRGGRPTEVLFIVDGIEFENVNHFSKANGSGGPVGFINSDFIKSISYYAGSMPAEYPSRLSSVICFKMNHGSLIKYNGSAAAKWTGGMLSFEGPLVHEYGSIVAAARYINFESLSKFIENGGIPKLGDIYVKCLFAPNEKVTMYATGLFSYNHSIYGYQSVFFADSGSIYNRTNEIEQIGQGGGGFTIRYQNRITQELTAGISFRDGKRYDSLSDFNTGYFRSRFAQNPIWENNISKVNRSLNYKAMFNVGRIDSIVAGARLSSCMFSIKLGEYSQNSVQLSSGSVYSLRADTNISSFHGKESGCFLDIPLQKWCIKVNLGLRYDFFGLLDKHTLSPSIVADCTLPSGIFTLSYGLYHQFPVEMPLLLFDNLSGTTLLSGDSLERLEMRLLKSVNPYRCKQFGIGYKTRLFDQLFVKSDAYYKWYDREFLYTSQFYISLMEMGSDGVFRISEQNGKRKSMGIELMFKNDDQKWYHFSIGGSVFRSLNKYANGQWYHDWTDVRYTVSASGRVSFLEHHMLSLTASAMGGRPYTKQKTLISPFNTTRPEWFNDRLDKISYVNFLYVYKTKFRALTLEGSIEIINLFNAQPALDYRFNGERYIKIVPFGITPIVGVAVNI